MNAIPTNSETHLHVRAAPGDSTLQQNEWNSFTGPSGSRRKITFSWDNGSLSRFFLKTQLQYHEFSNKFVN